MENKTPLFKHRIEKRTRHIWYEGDKYHRRSMYRGYKVYIIYFLSVSKCQIEFMNREQAIVDVEDVDLVQYKTY